MMVGVANGCFSDPGQLAPQCTDVETPLLARLVVHPKPYQGGFEPIFLIAAVTIDQELKNIRCAPPIIKAVL